MELGEEEVGVPDEGRSCVWVCGEGGIVLIANFESPIHHPWGERERTHVPACLPACLSVCLSV
jgi:hypothetical protein